MSIFTKVGKEVKQAEEQIDRKKVLRFLSSGDSIKVRVPNAETYGEYLSHGGYTLSTKYKVYNMPCLKHAGQPDIYDDVVPHLYNDAEEAEKAGDMEKAEQIKTIANELRAKKRMLFGFIDLATGDQIVVDVTKNQGDSIVDDILEYEENLEDTAFVLSKKGTGPSTSVSLSPILNPKKGLNSTEQSNFEGSAGEVFDTELFEKIFFVKPREMQIEDMKKIGFDLSRIGIEDAGQAASAPKAEEKKQSAPEIGEEDLPF